MMMAMSLFLFPCFGFGYGSGSLFYFLPTIIAAVRNKRDLTAIVLVNLFLGWSIIGWIVALVWATKADPPAVAHSY